MNDAIYVVVNENCLGYTYDIDSTKEVKFPLTLYVLHGKILKGGPDWKNGSITVMKPDYFRFATKYDFDDYRVQIPHDWKPQ